MKLWLVIVLCILSIASVAIVPFVSAELEKGGVEHVETVCAATMVVCVAVMILVATSCPATPEDSAKLFDMDLLSRDFHSKSNEQPPSENQK